MLASNCVDLCPKFAAFLLSFYSSCAFCGHTMDYKDLSDGVDDAEREVESEVAKIKSNVQNQK